MGTYFDVWPTVHPANREYAYYITGRTKTIPLRYSILKVKKWKQNFKYIELHKCDLSVFRWCEGIVYSDGLDINPERVVPFRKGFERLFFPMYKPVDRQVYESDWATYTHWVELTSCTAFSGANPITIFALPLNLKLGRFGVEKVAQSVFEGLIHEVGSDSPSLHLKRFLLTGEIHINKESDLDSSWSKLETQQLKCQLLMYWIMYFVFRYINIAEINHIDISREVNWGLA